MSPPRKRRFAALSPQGAKKHLSRRDFLRSGRPGVFLVKTAAVLQGLTFAAVLLSASAGAAECVARAETVSVPLVELYTSEGCSSCPPADRWLSQQVPGRFVPLALHVDYWDYIGWRDRFAQARFSQRQRDMVNRGGGRVVYTPQVMLNGRDFRPWHSASAFDAAIRQAAARPLRAKLLLAVDIKPGDGWTARLAGEVLPRKGRAEAYLALYENGLSSAVEAGENRGAQLRHDYVVRQWQGPLPVGADGRIALSHTFTPGSGVDFNRAGVAAFIQDADSGEVLQAVAVAGCKA